MPKHIENQVYPANHLNTPLWCVYGYDSFPSIICCMINQTSPGSEFAIWGYSVWKNAGGFRTLGVDALKWADAQNAHFFLEKEQAMAYLDKLVTPSKGALAKLK